MASDIDSKIDELHAQLYYLFIQYQSKQITEIEYDEEYDKLDKQIEILEQIRATDLYKAVYNNDQD